MDNNIHQSTKRQAAWTSGPQQAKRHRTNNDASAQGGLSDDLKAGPVSTQEHLSRLEVFARLMTKSLKITVHEAYLKDRRAVLKEGITFGDLTESTRFFDDAKQALDDAIDALGKSMTDKLATKKPEGDWYRAYLDDSAPHLFTWSLPPKHDRHPPNPSAVPDSPSTAVSRPNPYDDYVDRYAEKIRKSEGKKINRAFRDAAEEARVKGLRFEDCTFRGQPPAEAIKVTFSGLNQLVSDFKDAWKKCGKLPTQEDVNSWVNDRRHLVSFPNIVPATPSTKMEDDTTPHHDYAADSTLETTPARRSPLQPTMISPPS